MGRQNREKWVQKLTLEYDDGILNALKLRRTDEIRLYEHEIKANPALVITMMLMRTTIL